MTWAPTETIIATRAIPENLIGYCLDATRQADALTWAGGTGYKLVKTFQNSIVEPTKPVYPSIAFSDDSDAQDFTGDLVEAVYSVTFELSIQNANPDTAVTQARIYSRAFCSMIANCPDATVTTNTGALSGINLASIETGFLSIKSNVSRKNDFLQQVQIRTIFTMATGSHL